MQNIVCPSSSSESEDETVPAPAIKPPPLLPANIALPAANESKPASLVQIVDKKEPAKIPETTLQELPSSTSSPIQSLLDLQQMHHRQALAQQQFNFMLMFQQQQQSESDIAFRNLMQAMQNQHK